MQLFWGEPLEGVAERIAHLRDAERGGRARARAAGVRAADHHAGPRHHRRGLGGRRGQGREDGRGGRGHPGRPAPQRRGGPAAAPRPGRARRRARRLPLHGPGPVRRGRRRARRGWSGRRATSPRRCAGTRTWASPTSSSRTRRTARRSCGSATSCCRWCAEVARSRQRHRSRGSVPFLEADGLAELRPPTRAGRRSRARGGLIRSERASAMTLSFSWAASSLRRPAFSRSTSSSRERIAEPVCSASSHFVVLRPQRLAERPQGEGRDDHGEERSPAHHLVGRVDEPLEGVRPVVLAAVLGGLVALHDRRLVRPRVGCRA